MTALGFSRLATSVSCGPENAVLRNRALAPSFEQASTASIQPRWLRHITATLSPASIPSARSPWASEFVRSCTSRNESVPSSSMTAGSSGKLRAAAV